MTPRTNAQKMRRRPVCPSPREVHDSTIYVPCIVDPRQCIDLCGYVTVKGVEVDFKLVTTFVSDATVI